MFSVSICVVFLLVSSTHGANILAILPTPSYSHQIAMTGIWKELSLRGHKVTLVTTDPLNDPKLTNLTEIDMKWSYSLFKNISKLAEDEMNPWNFHNTVADITDSVTTAQIGHHSIKKLINDRQVKYHVVLTEFLYPEYLAIAEIHKCPKIIFGTLDVAAHFHNAMGNSIHPVLYPDMGLPFHKAKSFMERVISTLYTWRSLYIQRSKIFASKDKHIKEHFNMDISTEELTKDTDLLLLNVNEAVHNIRAVSPTTINIGDLRPGVSANPLPKDLKSFLDSATEGFVYFSLGSNVKSKELNKNSLENILHTLGELPYKVLWKFEDDHLPGKPQNVKLVKWAPQLSVLGHRNIKLFVTQGGLQSMEEGIWNEVPFVVIPFFADQNQNAAIMEEKGIAVIVNRYPYIKKEELLKAILEVADNIQYKTAVKKLRQLAMDTPMTGLEKAVWWIEYVIRNKGAKHLRNPAADIPLYQYYLLDVIGFLLIIAITTLSLVIILVRKAVYVLKYCTSKTIDSKKAR